MTSEEKHGCAYRLAGGRPGRCKPRGFLYVISQVETLISDYVEINPVAPGLLMKAEMDQQCATQLRRAGS